MEPTDAGELKTRSPRGHIFYFNIDKGRPDDPRRQSKQCFYVATLGGSLVDAFYFLCRFLCDPGNGDAMQSWYKLYLRLFGRTSFEDFTAQVAKTPLGERVAGQGLVSSRSVDGGARQGSCASVAGDASHPALGLPSIFTDEHSARMGLQQALEWHHKQHTDGGSGSGAFADRGDLYRQQQKSTPAHRTRQRQMSATPEDAEQRHRRRNSEAVTTNPPADTRRTTLAEQQPMGLACTPQGKTAAAARPTSIDLDASDNDEEKSLCQQKQHQEPQRSRPLPPCSTDNLWSGRHVVDSTRARNVAAHISTGRRHQDPVSSRPDAAPCSENDRRTLFPDEDGTSATAPPAGLSLEAIYERGRQQFEKRIEAEYDREAEALRQTIETTQARHRADVRRLRAQLKTAETLLNDEHEARVYESRQHQDQIAELTARLRAAEQRDRGDSFEQLVSRSNEQIRALEASFAKTQEETRRVLERSVQERDLRIVQLTDDVAAAEKRQEELRAQLAESQRNAAAAESRARDVLVSVQQQNTELQHQIRALQQGVTERDQQIAQLQTRAAAQQQAEQQLVAQQQSLVVAQRSSEQLAVIEDRYRQLEHSYNLVAVEKRHLEEGLQRTQQQLHLERTHAQRSNHLVSTLTTGLQTVRTELPLLREQVRTLIVDTGRK